MESKDRNKYAIKYSIVFFIVYLIIWFAPGVIVYPIDSFLETISGHTYVDSWTPGLMTWTASVILFPVIYIVFLAVLVLLRKKNGL